MSEPTVATFEPGTDPTLYSNKVDQQSFIVLGGHSAVTGTIVTTAAITTVTAPQYLLNINTGEIIYAEGISSASFTSCTRGAGDSTATTITNGDILVPVHAGNEWNQLVREIIAITDYISNLDWRPVTDSWTYASATTINTPSGATAIYEIGDKIRLKQGGAYKYYYVTAVAASLLTVNGGSDFTVANAGITNIYYSKALTPVDFPQWFNYTPSYTYLAGGTTTIAKFNMIGKIVKVKFQYTFAGADITGAVTISLPITADTVLTADPVGICVLRDAGTALYKGVVLGTSTTVMSPAALKADATYLTYVSLSATVPHTWAVGDNICIEASYQIA
jgi:hypothetical protein